jgi:tetratricopeptide (TPR) repeat protein
MSPKELSIEEAYSQALQILGDPSTQTAQLGQAIELLNKIRENGWTSSQLEANLGRSYARLENWPKSIVHFQESVRLDRWNSTLRSDLMLAQEKVEGAQGLPLNHPAEWGYRIASHARPAELFATSLLLCWVVLFFVFIKRGLPRKIWIPSVLLIAFGLGLSAFGISARSLATVVSPAPAPLRSAPLENSEELMLLRPGTRVRILRTSGSFTEVERPNSFRGWMDQSSLYSVPL